MYTKFPSFEKMRSPIRSSTPLSHGSSNFETILNDSGGYRNHYEGASMHKTIEDDFLKCDRLYPNKSNLPYSENISQLLDSLENELKSLDYSFEFKLIGNTISAGCACIREAAIFLTNKASKVKRSMQASQDRRNPSTDELCMSCVKMKNLMEEAKFCIDREKESLENTEKHLKHYDSLLAIKENRLREQELAFENEKNMMEIQKSEVCREKIQIEKEKDSLKSNFMSLNSEKETLEKQMYQLEKKYQDVKKILNEYENQKNSIENTVRSEAYKSVEARENTLKYKELEFIKQQEDFKVKTRQYEKTIQEKSILFERLKQDLIQRQQKYVEKNEQFKELNSSVQSLKEELDKNEKELRSDYEAKISEIREKENNLTARGSEIDTLYIKLNEDRNKLELYISTINDQKEEIEQEMLYTKRSAEEKAYQAQVAEERFRERLLQIEAKERKLDDMIEAFQEEEGRLDERWKNLEKIESISNELEQTKEKYANLYKNYTQQQQELNECRIRHVEKPAQVTDDMKIRIENLRNKEEELNELEMQLKRERRDIDTSAALIKQLHEDLELQKIAQKMEQQKLNELAGEISKYREGDSSKINVSHLEMDKSYKNSSLGSFHANLVSDMSPFEDKDIFSLENPFNQ